MEEITLCIINSSRNHFAMYIIEVKMIDMYYLYLKYSQSK